MSKLKKVLIMAGGTGGHIFPGLAVAKKLSDNGVDVQWLGTLKGLESKLVKDAGYKINFISISGLRGKSIKNFIFAPFKLISAIIQSIKIIKNFKPDIVIGMGGFVSGPGGLAGFILRKKLIIHEQNAKPGLTNQVLAKLSDRVLQGFPNTFSENNFIVTTGNPLRQEVSDFISPEKRVKDNDKPHLLIFGGSLGARFINELLPKAIAKIPEDIRPIVMHQSGIVDYNKTLELYAKYNLEAKVYPFIDEMDKAYSWADMVLCRSGALTISELCAVGLGGILVPYPYAVDDHQTANAKFMSDNKAAVLVKQSDLSLGMLVTLLKDLCGSRDKRLAMGKAAFQLRRVAATEKVLNICKEVFH
ncbi:undecaprenyldiphospho-muramoylpentapeptide beta-N-acetylglucosaminyltransferase [Gammaproteobacteria bacterium]|nr:undecaprenyldiphospho-muramoylpentapeptide beta-N-acetylglucosaminyltransferase [Gammaproteobacteria bacterium]